MLERTVLTRNSNKAKFPKSFNRQDVVESHDPRRIQEESRAFRYKLTTLIFRLKINEVNYMS